MVLGELIKNYRDSNSVSMDAFSEKSGISKAYISMLEKNLNPKTGRAITPSIKLIKQVADTIGIDFNAVFNMIDGDVTLGDIQKQRKSLNEKNKIELDLTSHEKKVMIAYRKQPDMQAPVDRILGIEKEPEKTVTNIKETKPKKVIEKAYKPSAQKLDTFAAHNDNHNPDQQELMYQDFERITGMNVRPNNHKKD